MKWAEVDARAIERNVAIICGALRNSVALMAVVKANGYGHGASAAAIAALAGGATWLGVSSPEEALELRAGGLDVPILNLGWSHPAQLNALITGGIELSVWSPEQIAAAAEAAAQVPARVHVKIDTGMRRLGAAPAALGQVIAALDRAVGRVEAVGAFTHFASADAASPDFTLEQNDAFVRAVEPLRERWPGLLLHAANSAAALRFSETHHDLVRCGIAIYGYAPLHAEGLAQLYPAMAFKACVTETKTVYSGDTVGYGGTWVAQRDTRVATIAVGYADGVQRAQSNRGTILIGGRRCPIVGRVSMDQLTADISEVDGVHPRDAAVVFGRQGAEWLGADEVAATVGTISNEVLCAVSGRVRRVAVG
jgi:alanine racemase